MSVQRSAAMMNVKVFLLFTCISLVDGLTSNQLDKLENLIEEIVRCRKVSGLSVALVRKNESVYTRGFGFKRLHSSEKVTKHTLFSLASESKAFTSTVAADAVARGKINWDDPVRKVLGPEFRLQDDFRSEQASLRDFLSHRTGFPYIWNSASGFINVTRCHLLERLGNISTDLEFRQGYHYSNFMYVAGAAVVERASLESWEDSVYDRIFKPLGMTGSRVSTRLAETDYNNLAYSHLVLENGTFVENDEVGLEPIADVLAPAAGVYSNAEDMAKWMRFHLNEGKNEDGDQVIDAHALKETYAANTAEFSAHMTRAKFPVGDFLSSYAMGWRNGVYNGYRKLMHSAAYNEYQGTLTLLPEAGVGVWVQLSGAADGNGLPAREVITMYSLDLLLGQTPWLNASTACTFPSPWKVKHVPPTTTTPRPPTLPPGYVQPSMSINVDDYPGSYTHPAFGTIEIFKDNSHWLQLAYRYGGLMKGFLNPNSNLPDAFFQTLTGPMAIKLLDARSSYPSGYPVRFGRDENNTVDRVTFHFLSSAKPFTIYDSVVTSDLCKVPSTTTATTASSTGSQVSYAAVLNMLLFLFVEFVSC